MSTTNSNVVGSMEGFTQKDVERAIKQLAYRKAYMRSEKARQERKERAERLKLAMRYVREMQKAGGVK